MKYLRNPVSGEVKHAPTRLMARKYQRYGWVLVDRKDFIAYQRAQVQLAMVKTIPQASLKLGRLQ